MVAALRPEEPTAEQRPGRFRPRRRHRPGSMLIKCFRDIPSADLNTLLPDVKVIMGQRDKWMIGVPALFGGIPLLLKLGPTLAVLAILLGLRLGASGEVASDRLEQALIVTGGLLALGGFVMHQWVKYQRQALRYQLEINGNLYFRNVSNNAGMFDAIIGAAEEQEFKEAAPRLFLPARRAGQPGRARPEDRGVARDAVRRQRRFRARRRPRQARAPGACRTGTGDRLSVPPLAEALRRLDRRWDDFFAFAGPDREQVEAARLRA